MSKDRNQGPMEQVGEALGGAVGKMAGRANDMAMNAIGTVLGSALQQMGSWWATPDAEQASRSFGAREDSACREHFRARRAAASSADSYERARPAYQFGHVAGQNPEYRSKPFDEVEAELERAWARAGREHGGWSDVRDHVSFGYNYRASGASGAG